MIQFFIILSEVEPMSKSLASWSCRFKSQNHIWCADEVITRKNSAIEVVVTVRF